VCCDQDKAAQAVKHDLEFARQNYDNGATYRQSKQSDRLLSVAFKDYFL
jgi:hypothetical protein